MGLARYLFLSPQMSRANDEQLLNLHLTRISSILWHVVKTHSERAQTKIKKLYPTYFSHAATTLKTCKAAGKQHHTALNKENYLLPHSAPIVRVGCPPFCPGLFLKNRLCFAASAHGSDRTSADGGQMLGPTGA